MPPDVLRLKLSDSGDENDAHFAVRVTDHNQSVVVLRLQEEAGGLQLEVCS